MNKAIILTAAALLAASPAFAEGSAKKYAPGQQTNTTKAPGHSESAPGHQANDPKYPGHSESAPGQRANNPSTSTTGSNTGSKKY
jgi:hypothetical protein